MKKTYISPTTTLVVISTELMQSGSNTNPESLNFNIPTDEQGLEDVGIAD